MTLVRAIASTSYRPQSRPGWAASGCRQGLQGRREHRSMSRKPNGYGLDTEGFGFTVSVTANDEIVDPTPGGGP